MIEPSYRNRLFELKAILDETRCLFTSLHDLEEELQLQLINLDRQAFLASAEKRDKILEQLAALEERKKTLLPGGIGFKTFIYRLIGKSSQAGLLEQLETNIKLFDQVRAIHEVNRSLLQEGLRFSKKLEELFSTGKPVYNEQGLLKQEERDAIKNIDRNC